MMYKLRVVDVYYSSKLNRKILKCQDLGEHIIETIAAETLSPKVGDLVWVLIDGNLNYFDYHSIAVLIV